MEIYKIHLPQSDQADVCRAQEIADDAANQDDDEEEEWGYTDAIRRSIF